MAAEITDMGGLGADQVPSSDQESEIMFLEAMYGQDDSALFRIETVPKLEQFEFRRDVSTCISGGSTYTVFRTIIADSPNPISQLSVQVQFVLPNRYPSEPPFIGCKPVMGVTPSICRELVTFLDECAQDRAGQVVLFDLFICAGEWINSHVRETNQGSLHEMMLIENSVSDRPAPNSATQSAMDNVGGSGGLLEGLTYTKEAELRKQWLKKHISASRPLAGVQTQNGFSNNLSHTLSRITRTQGHQPLRASPTGGSSSTLLQAIAVLQKSLGEQQMLVSHLLSHWLVLMKPHVSEIRRDSFMALLESQGLVDQSQVNSILSDSDSIPRSLFRGMLGNHEMIDLLARGSDDLEGMLTHSSGTARLAPVGPADIGHPKTEVQPGQTSRYSQDFEELQYLGSGAFGDVWKVRNRLDGIIYAIKKVRIGTFRDSEHGRRMIANDKTVNRILREVTTLGRIHSPYVLRYHQAWIEEVEGGGMERPRDVSHNSLRSSSFFEGHAFQSTLWPVKDTNSGPASPRLTGMKSMALFIQTAYCPRTLSDFLSLEGRSATVPEMWRLCRMMLEGLAHIHSHGIMHRDLKPSNIFIDGNGDIRIGDFGLATFEKEIHDDPPEMDEPNAPDSGASEHSRKIGTKLYASPEQEGETDEEYDERTDIYSLGVIFFELWHPFSDVQDRIQCLSKLKDGSIPPHFAASHPRQWKLITTMMKKCVSERPTATAILQSDLLPPRMEDDFLNDALRVVSNPNTPVFPRILAKLFSADRAPVLSRHAPVAPIAQSVLHVSGFAPNVVILEQRKQWICDVFATSFARHGALRVSPPVFSPTLPHTSRLRGDDACLMDPGGSLLTLRYDSRRFFCHAMADAYADPSSPLRQDILFKRYDVGTVYRKPPREGYLPVELVRADFDIVGVDPVFSEIECLCVVSEIVSRFSHDINWIRVYISHVALYSFVLDQAEIHNEIRDRITRILIDTASTVSTSARKDKWDVIRRALTTCGLNEKQLVCLGKWFRTSTGSVGESVTSLLQVVTEGSVEHDVVVQIDALMNYLSRILGTNFREKEFMLDVCSPPPSEDYNGLFFRVDVAFNSAPDVGESVAAGGRIDNALKKYPEAEGCQLSGISWNVTKFLSKISVPPSGMLSSPDMLIGCMPDSKSEDSSSSELRVEQMTLASELWNLGVSVDVFYGSNSLQEQIEFASTRGIQHFVLIREKDITQIISTPEGPEKRRVDDFIVSVRILSGGRGKQAKETFMTRSELISSLH
jgi:serine/threonine protein kinase